MERLTQEQLERTHNEFQRIERHFRGESYAPPTPEQKAECFRRIQKANDRSMADTSDL